MVKDAASVNDIFYRYFIRSGWHGRVDTPATIGAKFLKTLDALSGIDPIFANWEVVDARNMSSMSLAAARSAIADVIENNMSATISINPLRLTAITRTPRRVDSKIREA